MTAASAGRAHLSWERFAAGFADGRSIRRVVPGSPYLEYFYEAEGPRIGLRVGVEAGLRPPGLATTAVKTSLVNDRGGHLLEVSTHESALFREFHDLAGTIVDRIRIGGVPADAAFELAVQAWEALLARPRGLGVEERIGLLGELHFLTALAADLGWQTALEAWKAGAGEEHDFGLPVGDVEVKTTLAERRRHQVSGLDQLEPSLGRPLWVVSIQYTRGGAAGRTTAEHIADVSSTVKDAAPASSAPLAAKLAERGWLTDYAELPDDRWILRTEPVAFRVDDGFPRLTPALFAALPPEIRERVDGVDYRIDLTDLTPAVPLTGLFGADGQGASA
ncbi:PD-(D/E)XK motif protein [Yinghuangia seranimata]|uniref:PD-(D/E)XK motif protein n=1 Tax=Yinghuangia seranimata TaxID=408067 RepID=UPI00248B3817|nr:PD-(D/E)XK motif protein [Yinghuangia seranimata]MDI2130879.1 PD-(D/E)XK motif protein [Yinghuangia seranimata]